MKNYLPFREKISYGFGDLASVLYWQTFMLYFTYFYTDIFLMPAAAAATMFLVSRLVDGFNDPIMGIIADRTNTRWGKFRPYLLWFCVPFAVIGVFTFTVPDFGHEGKIIWAYTTFMLIMILYTVINIPYTSLLGVISPNSAERTTVSSVKFIFAFAAGIIISATLLPMTQKLGEGDDTIMAAEINNDSLIINERKRGVSTFEIQAFDSEGNMAVHEIR
ncbi:MAG: MFS transporter, partial [Bacteroidota bacterium]